MFASSCSGQASDTVWRDVFVLYEKNPIVGAARAAFWDREAESSEFSVWGSQRHFSEIPLVEPARTGWFSTDGLRFHALAASGRLHTIGVSGREPESESNIGLSNPVEARLWKSRSVVAVARFSPPQVALLSSDEFSRVGAMDLPGRPVRLELDETRERLFVSIPEKDLVLVLGIDPLREIASLEFPAGSKPAGMAVDSSGALFVSRPGSGAVTKVSTSLTSRTELVVTGAPEAAAVGMTKLGTRLILADPVTNSLQILSTDDPLGAERDTPVGVESDPIWLLTTPDPHFVAFLSRTPNEIGFLDLWENRVTYLFSLPDAPVAVFIQPPRAPDKPRF